MGVLGVVTIALGLVSLLAAAGFVVLADRRARQLGMLGAVGASEQHLRLVVVTNGAVVGVVAAVVGAVAGVAAWLAAVPRMEAHGRASDRRVERAVVGDRGADDARRVGGHDGGVVAGASRGPDADHAGVVGTPAEAAADASVRERSPTSSSPSASSRCLSPTAPTVSSSPWEPWRPLPASCSSSPLALRGVAAAVGPMPVAVRLALRDLARHQARSGIAVAAIGLTLGIPVAIAIVSTAAEATSELGNMSDRQLLVWTRDPPSPRVYRPTTPRTPTTRASRHTPPRRCEPILAPA